MSVRRKSILIITGATWFSVCSNGGIVGVGNVGLFWHPLQCFPFKLETMINIPFRQEFIFIQEFAQGFLINLWETFL